MKRLLSNLTFWVLLAITTGALLGHYAPEWAVRMRILGTGFIEIIKVFIYPIIFLTISLGISGMSSLKKVGRVGGKAILYFEVVTTLALVIGVLAIKAVQEQQAMIDELKKHDKDPRGRTNDEITKLILQGIHRHAPDVQPTIVSDEIESIQYAMDHAPKDAFIVVCCDEVRKILEFVTSQHEKDQQASGVQLLAHI